MLEKKFKVQGSKFKVGAANFKNFALVTGKPRLLTKLILGTFLLLTFGICSTPALAHRVLVFAYAEGDTIHVEGKFVPNTPVRQGEVQVLDQKTGKVLLTGKTDNQGKFSFKIPAAAAAQKLDLKIVMVAAMGHQGEWLLKAKSYLPGAKGTSTAPAPPSPPAAASPSPAAPGAKSTTVDSRVLEEVVNKALERQLAPVKEMLTELTIHRTSLPDVLGGLGYILGFFGLWAYFQSKRKKDS
jgi:nickel transport protein